MPRCRESVGLPAAAPSTYPAPVRPLLVGLLCACGSGEGEGERVFALVPKAMNSPFFEQARQGCLRAARELPDVTCLYIGPGEHTEQEQVQIVLDLITRRVDGIAVAPSNAPAMARVLERAAAAGIPVITWDSDLLEGDRSRRAVYVGTRNYDIGVAQAGVLMQRKAEGAASPRSCCSRTRSFCSAATTTRSRGSAARRSGAISIRPSSSPTVCAPTFPRPNWRNWREMRP